MCRPRPTSTTATSTASSANQVSAAAVSSSNRVGGSSISASTRDERVEDVGERLVVDRLAVAGDPLVDPGQVRTGVGPDGQAHGGQQGGDHGRRRALAVGAGDVDRPGRPSGGRRAARPASASGPATGGSAGSASPTRSRCGRRARRAPRAGRRRSRGRGRTRAWTPGGTERVRTLRTRPGGCGSPWPAAAAGTSVGWTLSSTTARSTTHLEMSVRLGRSYMTSSSTSSRMARSPRAPVPRSSACSATASRASSVNSSSTWSSSKVRLYWRVRAFFGSTRMRISASL